MTACTEKLKYIISPSSATASREPDKDPIRLCRGRFASYFERETPLPGIGHSIYTNYTAIPEGFLLIGVSLDTRFNSLLLGHDSEFLPIARHKYAHFHKALCRFEELQFSQPTPGVPWLGIDRDPCDGAEISIICAMQPISKSIIRNPDALCNEITNQILRKTTTDVIELGLDILAETSDPINPVKDTFKFKIHEFTEDIKDPKKVMAAITNALAKKFGGELLKMAESVVFDRYSDQILSIFGTTIHNYANNYVHGRANTSSIKPIELAQKLYKIAK